MLFKVGDIVKHSEYSIRPKRDYWLSLGREPHKSNAKDALDKMKQERGTVIEVTPGSDGEHAKAIKVQINGTTMVHSSLAYMWELA